jgi:hypothetical protein
MAEPEDLLSKADALMARHRPARTGAEPYSEFPVLDEVVDLLRASDDLPVLTERVGPVSLDKAQTEALAESVRASLLAALQSEINSLIEARLQEGLAPRVEKLFGELRGDLQLIAREILSDAIDIAVEKELERRKSGG